MRRSLRARSTIYCGVLIHQLPLSELRLQTRATKINILDLNPGNSQKRKWHMKARFFTPAFRLAFRIQSK